MRGFVVAKRWLDGTDVAIGDEGSRCLVRGVHHAVSHLSNEIDVC